MAIDWPKIRLLEGRLRWHRAKVAYRRRELAKWKITGDRAHHWQEKHLKEGDKHAASIDQKEIDVCRLEIIKWKGLLDPEELEVHRLEVAINALRPKTQAWHLGGLIAPGVDWGSERFDEGKDFTIPIFTAVRAPGNGTCIEWASDRPWPDGFGSPYAVVRLDDGPWHDVAVRLGVAPEFYCGHADEPLVRAGHRFTVGQPLSRVDHGFLPGRGWCEWGHWPPGPMSEGERFAAATITVWR
jgi:hypothetical protein